jgi:hypothetical protein
LPADAPPWLLSAAGLPDGTVGWTMESARLVFTLCSRVGSLPRSLDHKFGLRDEAIACLKQWWFTPGTKDGVAVPVLVQVEDDVHRAKTVAVTLRRCAGIPPFCGP